MFGTPCIVNILYSTNYQDKQNYTSVVFYLYKDGYFISFATYTANIFVLFGLFHCTDQLLHHLFQKNEGWLKLSEKKSCY